MANINVTISIDRNLKLDSERLLSELGLSMSGAMSIFLKQALRKGGLPFEVVLSPEQIFYQKLQAGQDQIDRGETVSGEELFKRLEKKYEL